VATPHGVAAPSNELVESAEASVPAVSTSAAPSTAASSPIHTSEDASSRVIAQAKGHPHAQ
jgi:hypothetical protein